MSIARMRQTRAAVLLAISLVAPACVTRVDPTATPQQQEQARLHDLQRVARVTERVGVVLLSLQNLEIAMFQAGRIPRYTHIEAQTYFKVTAQFVIEALDRAKDLTKPVEERRNGILEALKMIDGIQTNVIDRIPDQDVRGRLSLVVLSIQTILITWQMVT